MATRLIKTYPILTKNLVTLTKNPGKTLTTNIGNTITINIGKTLTINIGKA